uniref:HNH domain-containing protein n=1 Tax=viral metagenome TaxID=1070528 RepID=A0A6C0DQ95_9ZZZZ
MESKKILIDFSPKPKPSKENKKIEVEKERKKRIITQTNDWIKTEIPVEDELDIVRTLNTVLTDSNKKTEMTTNCKLVLRQLNYKICGYRGQDIEKEKYCQDNFVSVQNIIDLMLACNNICYYCKKPVKLLYDFVREPQQWTLDRIDNDFGHNHDNVAIACLQCNLRRKTMYHERYLFTKQMVITKTG